MGGRVHFGAVRRKPSALMAYPETFRTPCAVPPTLRSVTLRSVAQPKVDDIRWSDDFEPKRPVTRLVVTNLSSLACVPRTNDYSASLFLLHASHHPIWVRAGCFDTSTARPTLRSKLLLGIDLSDLFCLRQHFDGSLLPMDRISGR